jgi:hypothetical protein
MYVRCYSSHAAMDVQEQIWLVLRTKGWLCAGPVQGINYYYIPEYLVTWCLLIDPSLRHYPSNDWIV